MKVLAFAATNSSQSINKQLVTYAAEQLRASKDGVTEVEVLDLNDFEMPIYSPDRQRDMGIPQLATEFFAKISEADAVLVSFAEYNGSVTAAWKNIFDWMSRIERKLWQGKPVVFLSATPGPRAGEGVLAYNEMIAPHFGADLKGSAGFGPWQSVWNNDTRALASADEQNKLMTVLSAL